MDSVRARLITLLIAAAITTVGIFGLSMRDDPARVDNGTSPGPEATELPEPTYTPTPSTTPPRWRRESFDVGAEGPFVVAEDGIWAFSRHGQAAQLTLIRVDPDTGDVARGGFVKEPFFGGIVVLRDEVWTVSNRWDDSGGPRRGAIQRWDRDTLELLDTRIFRGERPSEIASTERFLWITNPGGEGPDEIWKMDPSTGQIIERIEVGAEASGILATESAIWVSDAIDGGVWKIDPSSARVVETVAKGASCSNEMRLSRKTLWVVTCDGLIKIDRASSRVVGKIHVKGVVTDIAWAFGRLWALDLRGDTLIGIDPATSELTGDRIKIPDADSPPSDVEAGNGSLYVTSIDGVVTRISK